MRAFVAIFPPPEVRESLLDAARKLPIRGEVRWSTPENVHLTLKFLGEVPEEDLQRIGGVLETVAGRHGAFEIEAGGFGAFPSARRARILWAGVGDGADELRDLAEDVELSLAPLGFEKEGRTYSPHLSLGRARGRPARLDSTEAEISVPRFTASHLQLVKSVLDDQGATYSTLAAYPLTGKPVRRRRVAR